MAQFINEAKRFQKLANIKENTQKLSSEEQKIADDILKTLDEGMFSDVLEKVKSYAKKGLMTAAILGALLSAPNFSQAQQQQIKQVAQTEMSSTQEKGGKEWEQIKKAVSSTSPKFIDVKGDQEMGIKPFQSLNWGAHKSAGSSAGISISYEKGSGVIDIEVTHVAGKDKKGYDQIVKNLQDMGVKDKYSVKSESGFSGEIPVSKANDIVNFINTNLSLLKEINIESVVNEALAKFRKKALNEEMKFNDWINLTDAEKKNVEQTYNQNKPLADKMIAAAKNASADQAGQLYRNMTNMWQRYLKPPFVKNDYSVSNEVNTLLNDLNKARVELRKKYPEIEKTAFTTTPPPPKKGPTPPPRAAAPPPLPPKKTSAPPVRPIPAAPTTPAKQSIGSKIKSFFKGK